MPSVSVIVPVYQAEEFLNACVASVTAQTFSDWELLLVDDGCTDASPALCDACAAADSRVRVIPVSYTHLDVYKRQEAYWVAQAPRPLSPREYS